MRRLAHCVRLELETGCVDVGVVVVAGEVDGFLLLMLVLVARLSFWKEESVSLSLIPRCMPRFPC